MSVDYDRLIMAGMGKEEDIIKLADQETKVVTFKDVLGVTENKALLDEIKETKINISNVRSRGVIKIQKVPEIMLRNRDLQKYFKARELSIGPIYAADPGLFKKELKLKLVAHFISDQSDRTGDDLVEEIKSNIVDIKPYFENKVIESYSDEDLIRLLFLDGCAMLGFIHIYLTRNLNTINISNGQAFLIQQDLFLFENQIPFRVLEVLMGLDKKPRDETRDWEEEFLRFLRMSNVIAPNASRNAMDKRFFHHEVLGTIIKPVHILDLNRRPLLGQDDYLSDNNKFLGVLGVLCCMLTSCVFPIFCFYFSRRKVKSSTYGRRYQGKKLSFPNVGELKTAVINFKPTDSLMTISFRTRFFITGKLTLPTLVLDDSTTRKLFNLVAYEMCLPPGPEDCWVTSYINLLDLLIDSEQDVKDLRAVDIVRNCLSSDIEVAKLINNVGSLCFTPTFETYEVVKEKIEKHYKRRCAIWMG